MAEIFNIEEYIKDLTPEQQEKARACKTKEELNAFIAENEIELDDEVLAAVSGGSICGTGSEDYCPDGQKHSYVRLEDDKEHHYHVYKCTNCNKIAKEFYSTF